MRRERLGGLIAASVVAIAGLAFVVPRDGLGGSERVHETPRGDDSRDLPPCGRRPLRDGEDCAFSVFYTGDGRPSRLTDDLPVGEPLPRAETRKLLRLARR